MLRQSIDNGSIDLQDVASRSSQDVVSPFYVNDGDRYSGEIWSEKELENFWDDNKVFGAEKTIMVMAPEDSDKAGLVPANDFSDEVTQVNLRDSIFDVVCGAVDTAWPFTTSGSFVGFDQWASNVWKGHADFLGATNTLPHQGLAFGFDRIGGWIGGSAGQTIQELSRSGSETGREIQDVLQDFHRDPINTVKAVFGL